MNGNVKKSKLKKNFLKVCSTRPNNLEQVKVLVAQSHSTLQPHELQPHDRGSPPGSSVHGILQAKILEWVAIVFSRGSFRPRDRTQVPCIAGRFFTIWAIREAQNKKEAIQKLHWKCPLKLSLRLFLVLAVDGSSQCISPWKTHLEGNNCFCFFVCLFFPKYRSEALFCHPVALVSSESES